MSLATRLTMFSLSVLAAVLLSFSMALYALATRYLHQHLSQRVTAAAGALTALAEVTAEGVEWEPRGSSFYFGQNSGDDEIRWLVDDARGNVIDRSTNLDSAGLRTTLLAVDDALGVATLADGSHWSVQRVAISAATMRPKGSEPATGDPTNNLYPSLHIAVAASLSPVAATLRWLALTLAGLSLAVWTLAAVAAHRLCRRALRPLEQMADVVRTMTADDWHTRLPNPGTGDELETLSHTFNQLLTRLEESFQRQRRFTGDAAHQLRTPLTGMIGQVDVALLRERSPAEYTHVLDTVQLQARRLQQIVETLLYLARTDAESWRPELESVELSAWLQEHMAGLHEHPCGPNLRCELPDRGDIFAATHPALLGQLLDNLLDNAVKYGVADKPIVVRLSADGQIVQLMVEDSGCGIAPDDLPHLFEPFFRSPEARRTGVDGVGLGLSISLRIAQSLGATLTAENRTPESGARFVLSMRQSPAAALVVPPTAAVW